MARPRSRTAQRIRIGLGLRVDQTDLAQAKPLAAQMNSTVPHLWSGLISGMADLLVDQQVSNLRQLADTVRAVREIPPPPEDKSTIRVLYDLGVRRSLPASSSTTIWLPLKDENRKNLKILSARLRWAEAQVALECLDAAFGFILGEWPVRGKEPPEIVVLYDRVRALSPAEVEVMNEKYLALLEQKAAKREARHE